MRAINLKKSCVALIHKHLEYVANESSVKYFREKSQLCKLGN